MSGAAEPLDVGGEPVAVPGEECAVLLIALHAAAPARANHPRTDLLRALQMLPDGAWQAAAELAERCDALTVFSAGLHLVPAGAALATRLQLTTSGSAPEWLRARWIVDGLLPRGCGAAVMHVPPGQGRTGLEAASRYRYRCRCQPQLLDEEARHTGNRPL